MIKIQDSSVLQKFDLKDPAIWIASWLGSGFIKPAPGTWGTVAALPFGIGLMAISPLALIAGIVLLSPIGFWASDRFTAAAGEKDSSMIVVDEVIGMWIALIPVAGLTAWQIVAAFLLFRFFDVLKPWPISYLDKHVGGSAGVIADDVVAGIFAALCLLGLQQYV